MHFVRSLWLLNLKETQWNLTSVRLQSISFVWWRVPGSNRWPPACKAGALPAELTPHRVLEVVGQNDEPTSGWIILACARVIVPSAQLTILPKLFFEKWWAKMDSNHRPHDYQSCALASWAIGPSCLHFFWCILLHPRAVPSKLNNVKYLSLCTDLRTLLENALLF